MFNDDTNRDSDSQKEKKVLPDPNLLLGDLLRALLRLSISLDVYNIIEITL
jgi:hypothetical protein